jgi:chromosome partitioning protein
LGFLTPDYSGSERVDLNKTRRKKMRVISIANQKGGCGKTTTTINLSACLAAKGRRVLLIDLDPQGHSSMGLNVHPAESQSTLHDALGNAQGVRLDLEHVIVRVGENLDIAPSDLGLSTFEQHLSMVQGRETRLKQALEGLPQPYDYIIIDCPPSLGLLTFNALMASTEVFIPIEMSVFSLHGTGKLLEIIELVRTKTGHEIRVKVLATMFDGRTRMANEVLKDMEEHFRNSLFSTIIHASVRLREAASQGKAVVDYGRKSKASADYMSLAQEVVEEEKLPGVAKSARSRDTFLRHRKTQFSIHAPEANSVKVVGNFSNWTQEAGFALDRHEDGNWSKEILLPPGVYQYKFLVDGRWVEDQGNPNLVQDPYGGRNAVLEIH